MPIEILAEDGDDAPNQASIPAAQPKITPRADDGSDNAWPSGDDAAKAGATGIPGLPGLPAGNGQHGASAGGGVNFYINELTGSVFGVTLRAGDGGNGGKGGKGGPGGEGQDGGRGDGDVADADGGRGGDGGQGGTGGNGGNGGSCSDVDVHIADPDFTFADIDIEFSAGRQGNGGDPGDGGDPGLGGLRGGRVDGPRSTSGSPGPQGVRGSDGIAGVEGELNIYLG